MVVNVLLDSEAVTDVQNEVTVPVPMFASYASADLNEFHLISLSFEITDISTEN